MKKKSASLRTHRFLSLKSIFPLLLTVVLCLSLLTACARTEGTSTATPADSPSPASDAGLATIPGSDVPGGVESPGADTAPNPNPPQMYDLAALWYEDILCDAPPGGAMGTGGTEWLFSNAPDYGEASIESEQIDAWEEDPDLRFFGTYVKFGDKFDAASVDKMQKTLQSNRVMLAYDQGCFDEQGYSTGSSVSEEAFLWGGLVSIRQFSELSGYQKNIRTLFDPVTGEKLKLSDLFYDSVDYLSYINTAILSGAAKPIGGREVFVAFNDAQWQMRPFFGIPAQYEHFYFDENGDLLIELPPLNPYFFMDLTFVVPLDSSLSPYGSDQIRLSGYDTMTVGDGFPLLIPQVRSGDKEKDAQINQKVSTFIGDSLAQLMETLDFRNTLVLVPEDATNGMINISLVGSYLSISLRRSLGIPPTDGSSFVVCTFNVETLEEVDPLTFVPAGYDWEKAQYGDDLFTVDYPGYGVSGRLDEDFRPPAQPLLKNAHFDNGNLVVEMMVTDKKAVSAVVLSTDLTLTPN